MSHISLRDLNVRYGSFDALHRVTVDIPDGGITAIIGPSGCGKTTLLKGLNRLNDLQEDVTVKGRVLIDGVNIYDQNADILSLRKKVGFLSQKPYPLPMSIRNNILFGPRIHGMNDEQIGRSIERMREVSDVDEECYDISTLHGLKKKKKEKDCMVEYYLRLSGLWCLWLKCLVMRLIYALPLRGGVCLPWSSITTLVFLKVLHGPLLKDNIFIFTLWI